MIAESYDVPAELKTFNAISFALLMPQIPLLLSDTALMTPAQ